MPSATRSLVRLLDDLVDRAQQAAKSAVAGVVLDLHLDDTLVGQPDRLAEDGDPAHGRTAIGVCLRRRWTGP
jgi:hypothetical protein